MKHSTFTLADKMQYVSKLLGYQMIVVDDCRERIKAELLKPGLSSSRTEVTIDLSFVVLVDEFVMINAALFDVLNATEAQQATATVMHLKTSRGSKLN